jgi:phospholipase/lecithinase/hemolysin
LIHAREQLIALSRFPFLSRLIRQPPATPETGPTNAPPEPWRDIMRKIWAKISLAVFVVSSAAALAETPTYSNLYVFGDSYCDVGNLFLATGGAEPAAPYYNGRFSNGPLWVDHVAGFLNLPMKPSIAGGTNYAFAGAWVTAPVSIPGGTIPSVTQQVEQYLSQHGGKADPHALYIIEGGGNDILDTTSGSPEVLGYEIAKGIAKSELMLRQAGARHFVIPNLFNVALLPAAAGNTEFAAKASTATNSYLAEMLAIEQFLEGVTILRMDTFSLIAAVGKDPFHFGFVDITDPCLTTTVCADPDHTFFWDTHHPTVFGHAFFAVTLENVLAAQP